MPTKRLLSHILLLVLAAASCGAAALPSITISSHHDRQMVHDGAVTLSGTASDPAGVTSITVSLNRGPGMEAVWNGSRTDPKENASWSIPLQLSEGANVIVVNATDSANESDIRTLLVDYSIPTSNGAGVILAGGSIIVVILLIALVALRVRRPPPSRAEDGAKTIDEAPEGGPDQKN